jgi:hypothetical protein
MTSCEDVGAELAELVADDHDAIARHAAHLAGCEDCRDARYEARRVAARIGEAGEDYVAPPDLVARLLAAVDREAMTAAQVSASAAQASASAAQVFASAAQVFVGVAQVGDGAQGAIVGSRPRVTERGWVAKPRAPRGKRRSGARVGSRSGRWRRSLRAGSA